MFQKIITDLDRHLLSNILQWKFWRCVSLNLYTLANILNLYLNESCSLDCSKYYLFFCMFKNSRLSPTSLQVLFMFVVTKLFEKYGEIYYLVKYGIFSGTLWYIMIQVFLFICTYFECQAWTLSTWDCKGFWQNLVCWYSLQSLIEFRIMFWALLLYFQ